MRRFEVIFAVLLGILLPALETLRRGWGHWSVNFTTMFDDYGAGGILLVAAVAAWLKVPWASSWMVISWSGIFFMMLISSVSQIEKQMMADLEPHSLLVLAIKLLLFLASAVALYRAVGRIRATPAPTPDR